MEFRRRSIIIKAENDSRRLRKKRLEILQNEGRDDAVVRNHIDAE